MDHPSYKLTELIGGATVKPFTHEVSENLQEDREPRRLTLTVNTIPPCSLLVQL